MGLNWEYTGDSTALDEDEKDGLRIKSISTRSELDQFEQQNIEKAVLWTLSRKIKPDTILSEQFIKELHRRMYSNVWEWAGEFRKTNKNIGIDKISISVELKKLLDDCKYWITHNCFTEDEIVVRFKHRIVSIHCFPNGNGRHSRLMADVMTTNIFNRPVFTWGSKMKEQDMLRKTYLNAIKTADSGNIERLLSFARA
jgi:Fic-DOC domain mobile mystery protein B